MDCLSSLSPELHQNINSHLSPLSLHSLSLTCRYFSAIIGRIHLSKADTHSHRLQLERSDPARRHRVCSKCIRLRKYYHFSHKQASAKTNFKVRVCLDCFQKQNHPMNTNQQMSWIKAKVIAVCPECCQLVICSRVSSNGSSDIAPHVCRIGRDPEPIEGDIEVSVNRLRAALDRVQDNPLDASSGMIRRWWGH
jgi:hypothetical protein